MKLEVGDKVELNNGNVRVVERMIGNDPDHVHPLGYGPFVINGMRYHQNGRFGKSGSADSLSVKRILQKASSDTLENLNVGPGDVVEYDGTRVGNVKRRTIAGWVGDKCYHAGQDFGGDLYMNPSPCWRIISRASEDPQSSQEDEPKLWRDMTDEEKGALLLAHHEGARLHVWRPIEGVWREPRWEILFQDDRAYRIAPAATRAPIKIQGPRGEILGSGTMLRRDGEWDFDSIAVEDQ